MNHRLTITPGIPPGHRHGIEDVLKTFGYFIVGGGQMINGAESDISFDDSKDSKTESKKRPLERKKKCS